MTFTTTFTVARSFAYAGQTYVRGEVLTDGPIARAIVNKRPELLRVALSRTPQQIYKRQEV